MPVITSNYAGCAHELVIDGRNGYVLPLDLSLWVDRIEHLLRDPMLLHNMSAAAFSAVVDYSFDRAVTGLMDACLYASGI
jgi:glycosyltransferase involved in cell wall biosynthesis